MSYKIEGNKLTVNASGQTFVFKNSKDIKHGQYIIPFPQELLPDNVLPIARWTDLYMQNYRNLEYVETDRAKEILTAIQQHGGQAKKIVPQCNNVLRYANTLKDDKKIKEFQDLMKIAFNFIL